MGTHADLLARHREVMPSWMALYYNEPIALVDGEGRHVVDAEGNFRGVDEGSFDEFKYRVWRECLKPKGNLDFDRFESHLDLLGQANQMLQPEFLDHAGLTQVFWRNRSLQEFFAADPSELFVG